jgi:hypothetical protein
MKVFTNPKHFEYIQHDISVKFSTMIKIRFLKNVTLIGNPKSTNLNDEKILLKKISGLKIH